MLIEIHAIQNHSPANLNRDDLNAPKTCYFGGVLRSRISSQCMKRSIRMSEQFRLLCGGIRTRRLAELIAKEVDGGDEVRKRAEKILEGCGLKPKKPKKKDSDADDAQGSKMLVYTSREAVKAIAALLKDAKDKDDKELVKRVGDLIVERTAVPDMALTGRMLETGELKDTTVEAALQVAHAFSTHEARPEVDYYVAADDIPGGDAGAGYVDETMFASACFYKYFSIDWETLIANLKGNKDLAAHTVGAFIRAAALTNPTGKQNSFAAHNPPDGLMVEFKQTPISYANAFADPVPGKCERGMIGQSIAQLGQYVHDLDTGYGRPAKRLWFSPNLRHTLSAQTDAEAFEVADSNIRSLDDLIPAVIEHLGFDWKAVQKAVVHDEAAR